MSRLADLEYLFAEDPEQLSVEALGELVRLLQKEVWKERSKKN